MEHHIINADGTLGALGIDIGGVIVGGREDPDAPAQGDRFLRFLETPEVDGAIEAVERLVNERFGPQTHLVSKCGANVQARIRQWLDYHRFFERTGVEEGCVHFCRHRHEKAAICARLGITHFIDDRAEVLGHLDTRVRAYAFRPDAAELQRFRCSDRPLIVVHGWDDVLADMLG